VICLRLHSSQFQLNIGIGIFSPKYRNIGHRPFYPNRPNSSVNAVRQCTYDYCSIKHSMSSCFLHWSTQHSRTHTAETHNYQMWLACSTSYLWIMKKTLRESQTALAALTSATLVASLSFSCTNQHFTSIHYTNVVHFSRENTIKVMWRPASCVRDEACVWLSTWASPVRRRCCHSQNHSTQHRLVTSSTTVLSNSAIFEHYAKFQSPSTNKEPRGDMQLATQPSCHQTNK